MALNYGSVGILTKDYKVYIVGKDVDFPSTEGIIPEYFASNNSNASDGSYYSRYSVMYDRSVLLDNFHLIDNGNVGNVYIFSEFGECKKESIDTMIGDGDIVIGNNIGEITLNVNCSFIAELINATVDNINELHHLYDGKICDLMLVEIFPHNGINELDDKPAIKDTFHTVIYISDVIVRFAEKHTGGGVSIITLSVSKNTATADDFREIYDVDYDPPTITIK